jgi:hypothetical protein
MRRLLLIIPVAALAACSSSPSAAPAAASTPVKPVLEHPYADVHLHEAGCDDQHQPHAEVDVTNHAAHPEAYLITVRFVKGGSSVGSATGWRMVAPGQTLPPAETLFTLQGSCDGEAKLAVDAFDGTNAGKVPDFGEGTAAG